MKKSQAEISDVDKLEAASQKTAKSLEQIVKTVERSGNITAAELDAAFKNLSHLLLTAHRKAQLSLQFAAVTSGAARLTTENTALPAAIQLPGIPAVPPVALPLPSPPRERIAGENPRSHHVEKDDDDIDFIDE